MPYKDLEVRKAYKLAHSRLPAQRKRQAALRQRPGYGEYLSPIRRRTTWGAGSGTFVTAGGHFQ